jgi:hypothetical protein
MMELSIQAAEQCSRPIFSHLQVDADSREGRSQFAVAGVAATAAFVLALIHHFQGA